MIVTKRKI